MTNQHLITPPRGLVVLLRGLVPHGVADALTRELWLINRAYAAGADQELEACCEWLCKDSIPNTSNRLRFARRPKPPSLKDQALTALHAVAIGVNDTREQHQDLDTIRKALEALPND